MKTRWLFVLVVVLLAGTSCSRDPEVAKRKYLESGNRYFDRGKYNEASIMYRSALKKDVRYGDAYYRLGLTQLKLDNIVAAERSLRRAFELMKPGSDKDDATTKLSDIYLLAYVSDPRRTKAFETGYKDFLGRLPEGSFDRLRLEGYLAWRGGDLDGALERFEAAAKVKPMDANLTLAHAQVMIRKDRFPEAEKLVLGLIAKDKTNGAAYDLLYNEYLRRNRPVEAEQMRKQKSDSNPAVIDYRLQLAAHFFMLNKRDEADRVIQAVMADTKTFPKGRERCGDFYMTFRQFDKAIELYSGGLEGSKEERLNFQRKIADVLVLQGKRDQALALLDKEILKEHPNDPVGQALRASLWLETGSRNQVQQAVGELETVVGKLPRNPVVRYNLGRAYWLRGDMDLARAQFRAAVDMQPDYLAPRLALLQISLTRGEHAQALQLADETLGVSPGNQPARILRSLALQGMGKFDEARRELQNVLRVNPTSSEAQFRLGLLELTAKNFSVAEGVFRKCLENSQRDMICEIGLAEVYTAQGQFDRATGLLSGELAKNPDRRDLQLALANTSVLAKKFDVAVDLFSKMIAKEPESSDLHLRRAETYRRMGKIPEAIEGLRRVKQLQPNSADAAVWLALLLHQTGREADAKVEYEQILRLQPDNAVALNNLAYVIAEQGGDLDVALTYAQRAKQRLPQSPEVSDTLGWIYLKKQLTPNALEIYDDLVVKVPTRASFRFHRGMALFQSGKKAEARKELETALNLKPSPDDEGKIRDLLRKIG
ncbi:MAG TPA: tetratricopeptide repeat protein [Bryobacteraceae bacterium]|nr:tetratricopeptide repeat protein [Bryobacteraceae bacterium]